MSKMRTEGNATSDKVDAANRRKTRRRRTLLSGKIVFNDRWGALDCIVKDLSMGGAKIELGGWLNLPHEIELHLARGARFRCEVVRYVDHMMNVRFLGALT